MSFAGEQTRGRIESEPAGAGHVDLGPGVQIGEVVHRCPTVRRATSRRRSAAPDSRRRTAPPAPDGAGSAPAASPNRGRSRMLSPASPRRSVRPAPCGCCRRDRCQSCWFSATRKSIICILPRSTPASHCIRRGPLSVGFRKGFSSSDNWASYSNGKCSAYSSTKKSNGLITVISAIRSTSNASSDTLSGNTTRAISCPTGPAAS